MTEEPRLTSLITLVEQRHPDGDAVEQLSDAVVLSAHLGELADHLVGHFVDRARGAGASWATIGQSFGVTKQAAQKRFVPQESTDLAADLRAFARYTDGARKAVVFSKQEAERSGADSIQPVHLLLALLRDPDETLTGILDGLGVSAEGAVAALDAPAAAPNAPDAAAAGETRFSSPSRKAMEIAQREALRLEDEHIGTEHLLLGILTLDDPALAPVNLSLAKAEAAVSALRA